MRASSVVNRQFTQTAFFFVAFAMRLFQHATCLDQEFFDQDTGDLIRQFLSPPYPTSFHALACNEFPVARQFFSLLLEQTILE